MTNNVVSVDLDFGSLRGSASVAGEAEAISRTSRRGLLHFVRNDIKTQIRVLLRGGLFRSFLPHVKEKIASLRSQ